MHAHLIRHAPENFQLARPTRPFSRHGSTRLPKCAVKPGWQHLQQRAERCPASLLSPLQKYHVITEGSYLKADLSDGQELQTAADVPVTVSAVSWQQGAGP